MSIRSAAGADQGQKHVSIELMINVVKCSTVFPFFASIASEIVHS